MSTCNIEAYSNAVSLMFGELRNGGHGLGERCLTKEVSYFLNIGNDLEPRYVLSRDLKTRSHDERIENPLSERQSNMAEPILRGIVTRVLGYTNLHTFTTQNFYFPSKIVTN